MATFLCTFPRKVKGLLNISAIQDFRLEANETVLFSAIVQSALFQGAVANVSLLSEEDSPQ